MPLAHTGHWLFSVAYAAPVVGMIVWLMVVKVRERRSRSQPVDDERPVTRTD